MLESCFCSEGCTHTNIRELFCSEGYMLTKVRELFLLRSLHAHNCSRAVFARKVARSQLFKSWFCSEGGTLTTVQELVLLGRWYARECCPKLSCFLLGRWQEFVFFCCGYAKTLYTCLKLFHYHINDTKEYTLTVQGAGTSPDKLFIGLVDLDGQEEAMEAMESQRRPGTAAAKATNR